MERGTILDPTIAATMKNHRAVHMTPISLILPYPPAGATGNHAVKHGRGAHYLTDAAKRYRAHVNMAVATQGAKRHLEGPLAVEWHMYPPDRRARDCDNVRKTLADALTAAGLWVDDSNRVIRRELIAWGDPVKGGRIELRVRALAQADEKTG